MLLKFLKAPMKLLKRKNKWSYLLGKRVVNRQKKLYKQIYVYNWFNVFFHKKLF